MSSNAVATNPFNSNAVAERQAKPRDFPAMLQAWLPEIQRALPKHLSAERIARIALTAFRRNPKLEQCDPRSVFAAVIQSSQLGLEIDMLGRAYLVPYNQRKKTAEGWKTFVECQFIPGWKGLVDLMNRSGQGTVWTGAVFEGDEFDWQLGDNPFVHHKPQGENAPAKLTHVYAIGRVKGSDWPIVEVWPMRKIWKHRDRYNKVGESHYSFENQEMYARKIPLLQVLKYMPCSAELQTAIAMNDAAEAGNQSLSIKDAIEGSWAPPEEREVAGETDADASGVEQQEAQGNNGSGSRLRDAVARQQPQAGPSEAPAGDAGDAGSGAPQPYTDEAKALRALDQAKDPDAADLVVDLCRGQPFERAIAAARKKLTFR